MANGSNGHSVSRAVREEIKIVIHIDTCYSHIHFELVLILVGVWKRKNVYFINCYFAQPSININISQRVLTLFHRTGYSEAILLRRRDDWAIYSSLQYRLRNVWKVGWRCARQGWVSQMQQEVPLVNYSGTCREKKYKLY